MAIETLYLKEGDLEPPYRFKVVDSYNRPISLAGAKIYCTMVKGNGTIKINNSETGVFITDEAAGEVEYRWQAGDTDELGLYQIEFRIEPLAGAPFTVPTGVEGHAHVDISARLGT